MTTSAIIVAAGQSSRMGFDKVWYPLRGRPVVAWSVDRFAAHSVIDSVVVVIAADAVDEARELFEDAEKPVTVVAGGPRRRDSVAAGLTACGTSDWVFVHDAARPLINPAVIERGMFAVRRTGAAVPALPVTDTIKRARDGEVIETPPRGELWSIQTPQVFSVDLLRRALDSSDDDVTDEATLVERMGAKVRIFEGDPRMLKLTTQVDVPVIEAMAELLRRK